ncbi:hypothetical protein MTO96_024149 [Rhipicephalus appendiculatus]
MDLEKLVTLGEKMGLSGAELRKWVSQKEKEERRPKKKRQLSLKERGWLLRGPRRKKQQSFERERLAVERAKEERAAELEKERLAAERAKEEREAQERQIQAEMAERERQRQHEIELERLRLQQRIETPVQAREPRSEGTVEENPVKDATRAQDEAEVLKKVNHEVIVPDEKTCRAGDVPTKRPPTTISEKRTKSVAQTEHCVVPELAKHQQRTEERDNDLPVSNVSMVAEMPSTKPSSETARRKKNRKNKKRSSEHRKKGRKRGMRHSG